MPKKSKNKRNLPFDVLLWVAIGVAILGGTLSFLIFAGNATHFSIGYDKVYNALLEKIQDKPLTSSTPDPNDSVPPNPTPDSNTAVEHVPDSDATKIIEDLKELQNLQAQTNGRDLIVFVYQFISAVLVGIGAKMVADTKKNQKSVEDRCIEMNALANKASSQISWNEAKLSLSTAFNMIVNCPNLILDTNDLNRIETASQVLTRFNETLLGTLKRIKKMDIKMFSHDEPEYFISIMEGIKSHVNRCNVVDDTVMPESQVRYIETEIDEVINLLSVINKN